MLKLAQNCFLLKKSTRLAGIAFGWPELVVDRYKAVRWVHECKGQLFIKDLCSLAEAFIEKVGLLCSYCSDARQP